MPAKSEAQQRLFGMALAAKRGKGSFSGKVQELANSMSAKKLRDFAKTPHEGLPEKKAAIVESLKRLIEKKAFKIQNAPDSFGPKFHEILANTVGRVNPQNLFD